MYLETLSRISGSNKWLLRNLKTDAPNKILDKEIRYFFKAIKHFSMTDTDVTCIINQGVMYIQQIQMFELGTKLLTQR